MRPISEWFCRHSAIKQCQYNLNKEQTGVNTSGNENSQPKKKKPAEEKVRT